MPGGFLVVAVDKIFCLFCNGIIIVLFLVYKILIPGFGVFFIFSWDQLIFSSCLGFLYLFLVFLHNKSMVLPQLADNKQLTIQEYFFYLLHCYKQ